MNCRLIFGVILLLCLAGCKQPLSPADALMIEHRMALMDRVAAIPREPPRLLYDSRDEFKFAAEANCLEWSITLNYWFAASRPDFVIAKVIPHEYSHLASCFYRGRMDDGTGEVHDAFWRQWVKDLGGDPDYV